MWAERKSSDEPLLVLSLPEQLSYRRISSSLSFSSQLMKPFNSFPGKGLGKEESGISKAIKVNVKTDLAGVSYICFETVSLPPLNFSFSLFGGET